MKKTNLLLLLAGVMLFGCSKSTSSASSSGTSQGGTSDVTQNSTTGTSEVSKTNFEKFKDTFDSIGLDYVSDDIMYRKWSDGSFDAAITTLTVEPTAMFNSANRSGVALAKASDGKVRGYRYALDMYAPENESPMILSYKPATYLYSSGLFYEPAIYQYDENLHKMLFTFPSSEEVCDLSKTLYSKNISFEDMFEEGLDENENVTFTTTNYALALLLLDTNGFAAMDGYGYDTYSYSFLDVIADEEGYPLTDNIEMIFTLYEDPFPIIDVQIFAKNFDEEMPFMERSLYSLSTMDKNSYEDYSLSSIVSSDFYENGPGEEPAEVAAKRAAMKEKFQPMITGNNYTIKHSLGDQMVECNIVDDKVMTYGLEGQFMVSYYYIAPTEDFSNSRDVGVRFYNSQEGKPAEDGFYSPYLSLVGRKALYEQSGYEVDDTYVAKSTDGQTTVDIVEEIFEGFYKPYFNPIQAYLTEEGETFFNNLYGCNWEDLMFYNASTDSFVVTDYYLKTALFGSDIFASNYVFSTSYDLYLPEDGNINAVGVQYAYDSQGIGYYGFGTIEFTDVGTTKLPSAFAKYLNEHFNTTYEVAEEAAA